MEHFGCLVVQFVYAVLWNCVHVIPVALLESKAALQTLDSILQGTNSTEL